MHLYRAMSMSAFTMRPVQRGFSLVELMVSLTIGLIVSLAVMMGYLGAAQSQRGQTDISRIQETARFTFDLFGRETRHAAFRDNTGNPTPRRCFGVGGTGGCSTTTPYLFANNDATTPTLSDGSTPTVINKGDTITFRYFGADVAGSPGTADGTILNCLGIGIAGAQLNEDSLYIARDTSNTANDAAGEPTLYCSSRQQNIVSGVWGAATVVPLIPGVESMQILYGEDVPNVANNNQPDGVIDHYVTPANLNAANLTQVKSLMISVVVRSPNTSGFTANSVVVFNHFGQDYAASNSAPTGDAGSVFTAATDGRLRRVYNTLFAVRNAL